MIDISPALYFFNDNIKADTTSWQKKHLKKHIKINFVLLISNLIFPKPISEPFCQLLNSVPKNKWKTKQ